jgi:hypothetical protein
LTTVFHGHNDIIIAHAEELRLPVTEKEYESGTVELAKEVLKVLGEPQADCFEESWFCFVG